MREALQNPQSRCSPAWELIEEGYGAHLKLTTVRMNRTKLPKARACRGMPSNRPSRGRSRKKTPPAPAPLRPSGRALLMMSVIGPGCPVSSAWASVQSQEFSPIFAARSREFGRSFGLNSFMRRCQANRTPAHWNEWLQPHEYVAAVLSIDLRIFLGIPDSHGTPVWQSPQP